MKRKRKTPTSCIYCGEVFPAYQLQRDHVPPKGVFGKKRPANYELITVPCCPKCHGTTSRGDEALKSIIGMGAVRSPSADPVQKETIRSMERRPWWKKELVQSLLQHGSQKLTFEDGQSGEVMMIPDSVMKPALLTVERTARGLLSHYNPEFNHRDFIFDIVPKNELELDEIEMAVKEIGGFRHLLEIGGESFRAGWKFTEPPYRGAIMLQVYHGTICFMIFMIHRDEKSIAGVKEGIGNSA